MFYSSVHHQPARAAPRAFGQQTAFVNVRQGAAPSSGYVPTNKQYGQGPCGPCGPCEPCPCPNVCITNYGADLPFVVPSFENLLLQNTNFNKNLYALTSSPTCYLMAFSVRSGVAVTDATLGTLRRIDPVQSNAIGNVYYHPYEGYIAIPLQQLAASATSAVGPCNQGVILLDIPTNLVTPALGLSASTQGQESYLLPMQVNPCLLQTPPDQLTPLQRVILGYDATVNVTFGECRIGPHSCRNIGQFNHMHSRGQNSELGQYQNMKAVFTVLAFDLMVIIVDTNDHDHNSAPKTTYVNDLVLNDEDAWPIVIDDANLIIDMLNGSYIDTNNEEQINRSARHEIIWTQNPDCMLPNLSEQFVKFAQWYSAKLQNQPFPEPASSYPYVYFPKSRKVEHIVRAMSQYAVLITSIALAVPPLSSSRRIALDGKH